MAGQQIRRHVGKQVACILHEEGPTVPINVKPVQDNVIGDVLVLCELFSGENHRGIQANVPFSIQEGADRDGKSDDECDVIRATPRASGKSEGMEDSEDEGLEDSNENHELEAKLPKPSEKK